MSHLSIETLARLVDDAPSAEEAAHLQQCEECTAELEGLKADAAALAGLPELEPPIAQWYAVERRLTNEGLLRPPTRVSLQLWLRPALQIAAALSIFVLGHYTARFVAADPAPAAQQVAVSQPEVVQQATQTTPPPASLVENNELAPTALVAPRNREEAASQVRDAERTYLNALTKYAELATRSESADPVARLAALESIVLTTRAALGQAPADPVINGYHLTALAQRDATLKQLASNAGKTWF